MASTEAQQCFGPFRPIGIVSGSKPAAFTELYGEPMLMVPVRRTYQLYKGVALQLVRGGPEYEHEVTCVAQSGKLRYVAEGAMLHAMTHHKPLWSAPHNELLQCGIVGLLAIDDLIFSFGEDGKCVVRGGRSGEVVTEFALDLPAGVAYTCSVIPPHYSQKLLVGCSDGRIRLYNFATGKLIFATRPLPHAEGGAAALNPSITSLTASAFKGIIAYGTSDARAFVYHFEKDEVIAHFTHDSSRRDSSTNTGAKRHRPGTASAAVEALRPTTAGDALAPITAIAFRSDNGERSLATANSIGEIAFWDLQEKVLEGIVSGTKQVRGFDEMMQPPHRDAVHTLQFLPGKPMLVSCGADNAMLELRLDTVDGLALVVRERRGHTGRCTAAAFYNGDLLVTAGEDCAIRATHIFSDRAGWEMSQGKLGRRAREQGVARDALRLPPATQIVCNPARNYQWASIVTIHDCSAKVCGWRMDTRALQHKTEPLRTTSHTCTAVALSQCGNYACVGYSSGHVTRVHLQDQSLTHFYAAGEGAVVGGAGDRAHDDKVTGVEIFQWADVVVTSAADGTIKTWKLTTGEPIAVAQLGSAATTICGHRPSLLVAAGCNDFAVRVIAVKSGDDNGQGPVAPVSSSSAPAAAKLTTSSSTAVGNNAKCAVARTFTGHAAPVTCVALSPESLRHLVSCAADASLMVWDLAAAVCVAQYRVPSPATSVSFHPDSLFLATTHAGEPGAFLWTNRIRYGLAPEGITPAESLADCPLMHFPLQKADPKLDDDDKEGAAARSDEEGGDEAAHSTEGTAAGLRRATDVTKRGTTRACDEEGLLRVTAHGLDYWRALSHLDEIKARNEPLQPPKKASVPFFLPTTSELRPTFVVAAPEAGSTTNSLDAARFAHFTDEANRTEFTKMLVSKQFAELLEWMSNASPSLIDLRVRSVLKEGEDDDETGTIFEQNERAATALLDFVIYAVDSRRHFDMIQAFLKMLLTVHGELFASHAALVPQLERLSKAQHAARQRVEEAFGRVGCLTATFANAHS